MKRVHGRRFTSYVSTVAAVLFSTMIAIGMDVALAASDCIEQPNRKPATGGHWYYRTDRVNDRKCWYLVEPETTVPEVQTPEVRPSPAANLQQQESPIRSHVGQMDDRPGPSLKQTVLEPIEE
jgi:hypothetical protein